MPSHWNILQCFHDIADCISSLCRAHILFSKPQNPTVLQYKLYTMFAPKIYLCTTWLPFHKVDLGNVYVLQLRQQQESDGTKLFY